MKKLLSMLLAASMLVTFAACSAPATESETPATSEAPAAETPAEETEAPAEGDTFDIGIIQLVQHPALDLATQGFQEELTKLAGEAGHTINFDVQNASGEVANCATIATKFVNDDVDLILAVATPAAQAAAQATTEIPILVTAVTDPADANLVASNEAPGGNVSGTSDMNPIDLQADLLKQLVPDAQKVGIMYSSSEDNSILQAELAQVAFEAMGMEVVVATASDSNDIQAVTTNLIQDVDAIYIPTDNLFASSMPTVAMITDPAKIPVITGEENMAKEGGLATYSINYLTLGNMTAVQAADILFNGADISTMPIGYSAEEDLNLYINEETAAIIEVEVPADLLS